MVTVNRPWGKYVVVEKKPGYWIKKLYLNQGESLSLQRHEGRKEVWTVIKGEIEATVDSKTETVKPGGTVIIEKTQKHRMKAIHKALVIEVAFGEVLEGDNERLEDKYGRK